MGYRMVVAAGLMAAGWSVAAPAQTQSGPQAVRPAPLPQGADTPGGSARNGVIEPPPTAADPGINQGAPATGSMPVIPPPGSAGSGTPVVPR